MKKFILLLSVWGAMVTSEAQHWEFQIQRITGKPKEKMLKLKPEMKLEIGCLLTDNDTLKEYNYYNGIFIGGTIDSIRFRLNEVKTNSVFTNGIKQQSTIPAKYYVALPARDSNVMRVALPDVDYLRYRKAKKGNGDGIVEPLIWCSLLTLFLSPFISYNFKEGELNTKRYKNWALGSSAGLFTCFAAVITINAIEGSDKFRFNAGWPDTYIEEWRFKNQQEIK